MDKLKRLLYKLGLILAKDHSKEIVQLNNELIEKDKIINCQDIELFNLKDDLSKLRLRERDIKTYLFVYSAIVTLALILALFYQG